MAVATKADCGRGDEVSLVMETRWAGDLAHADCEARQKPTADNGVSQDWQLPEVVSFPRIPCRGLVVIAGEAR